MFKLALRGVRLNVGRYIATLIAIMTGVAFFTATGFLSDRVIDALEGDARAQYAEVDAAITVDDSDAGSDFADELRIGGDVVDEIAALPEVVGVAGDLSGSVSFLADDGSTFADGATGRLWIDDEPLNPVALEEGAAPTASGEIAVDQGTADDEDLAIGDDAVLLTLAGQQDVTVVGITSFGQNDAEDQDGTVSISSADAFDWLNSGLVEYDDLFLRTDGSEADLVAAVEPFVPEGFVLTPGQEFIDDKAETAGSFGRILKTGLQVFAALALFVGGFVIFNTFSVIVAQRLRELAVLAAIGATPKQIKRSLRFEGLVVGLLGSALGVLAGLGLTFLLIGALELAGVSLPGSGIKVSPQVVFQGLFAGTLITFFSVMRPAKKAAKTEPIEALRQSAVEPETLTRDRIVVTTALVGLGALGLLAAPNGGLLAMSAILFFVGMIVAGPLFALLGSKVARPVLGGLGLEGRLAADNVGRNPQRTATTSNALLIGVFLVTLVTVAGTSLKDFAVAEIDELASADFVMESVGGTVDDQLVADIEAIGDVEDVVPFRTETVARTDIENATPIALSSGEIDALVDVANIKFVDGSIDDLVTDTVVALDFGVDTPAVGDTVSFVDSAGDTADLTVAAIAQPSIDMLNLGYLVDPETFERFVGDTAPTKAFIDAKDGTQTDVQDEIEEITDLRPDLTLSPGNELSQLVGSIFDFMINAVNGLLLMSVAVALIGIVNTMSLSIIERKRELGLLRIIGMVDRRVRRMVRIESVIISVLGTLTGVVMGVFMGGALVFAINRLSDAGIGLNFAPLQLIAVLIAGVVLGYLAALIPASRSTKTEVLEAIQST